MLDAMMMALSLTLQTYGIALLIGGIGAGVVTGIIAAILGGRQAGRGHTESADETFAVGLMIPFWVLVVLVTGMFIYVAGVLIQPR